MADLIIYRVVTDHGVHHIVESKLATKRILASRLRGLFGVTTPVLSYELVPRSEARRVRVVDADRPSFVRSLLWRAERASPGEIIADEER